MIASITKGTSTSATLDYHFKKMEQGEAKLLDTNILTPEREEMKAEYSDIERSNNRVKNKCFHVSISLPKNENLSNDDFIKLGKDYMKGMGFEKTAQSIFLHKDKEHSHIHIVSPRIDYNGKSISDSKDHKKSYELCRKLETKYKLSQITVPIGKGQTNKLGLVNLEKYALQNAIKKSLSNSIHRQNTLSALGGLDVTSKPLGNKEVRNILSKNDPLRAKEKNLMRVLSKQGFPKHSYRVQLQNKLDRYKKDSITIKDYKQKIKQDKALYFREVGGKTTIGITKDDSKMMYFKEKQLAPRFRPQNLSEFFEKKNIETNKHQKTPVKGQKEAKEPSKAVKKVFPSENQKTFLKSNISKLVSKAKSFDELGKLCKTKGIDMKINGNNGVSFTSNFVGNPIEFKGSEIHRNLSYGNIDKFFKGKTMEKVSPPKTVNTGETKAPIKEMKMPDKSITPSPSKTPGKTQQKNAIPSVPSVPSTGDEQKKPKKKKKKNKGIGF